MSSYLKQIFRVLGKTIGFLSAFLLLVFMIVTAIGLIPVNTSFAQAPEGIEIYVIDNGAHTDLVLPVKTPVIDWRNRLPVSDYRAVDSTWQYVAFGWGDRLFYMETPQWKNLRPYVALQAVLWPTPSAMHVNYIRRRLQPDKDQRPVILSEAQYEKLVNYILHSFQQQDGSFLLIPGGGYSGDDNFYEAHGHFSFLKTCNTWTNNGLKAAGIETAYWAIFPWTVMKYRR
ncbi:TIGR02117 family protein [Adhaeribacter soli]|uniref:TIGR02117 family protein n=1 Tax=Adhaeribacter soli TaxID=2607655 RepID=A0A5N1IUY7_9BACT|nr:TIGR02117 family protein [Adhaeribacter soli]KAA9331749.1 TIGR02117 family protein [Adhaeribacter soli]